MIGFLHSQPCFLGGPNYTDLPYYVIISRRLIYNSSNAMQLQQGAENDAFFVTEFLYEQIYDSHALSTKRLVGYIMSGVCLRWD